MPLSRSVLNRREPRSRFPNRAARDTDKVFGNRSRSNAGLPFSYYIVFTSLGGSVDFNRFLLRFRAPFTHRKSSRLKYTTSEKVKPRPRARGYQPATPYSDNGQVFLLNRAIQKPKRKARHLSWKCRNKAGQVTHHLQYLVYTIFDGKNQHRYRRTISPQGAQAHPA